MPLQPAQFSRIDIPFEKVLARLGYKQGLTHIDTAVGTLVRESIALAQKLVTARQVLATAEMKIVDENTIYLHPGLTIKSRNIAELLAGCHTAAGFAVTVGPHIEDKRDAFIAAKEVSRAAILDAAGAVAAEELAEMTHRQLKEEAARGHDAVTRRFSPGYGDWALSSQKDFLAWLGARQIGITLTDHFTMQPEKSVSAILGIKRKG